MQQDNQAVLRLLVESTYCADRCMAQTSLESSYTAGNDSTKTVNVEAASPDCLYLVLQDRCDFITAQVGDSCMYTVTVEMRCV